MNKKGQAVAEMVLILPVLIGLAGVAMAVAYTCWQGIKVQEAANYAARIEGQERVAGATTATSINRTNGVAPGQPGDTDVSDTTTEMTDADVQGYKKKHDAQSVYGRYYNAVENMFNSAERTHLLMPRPTQGTEIDQVKVIRVMNSWSLFGFKIPQVVLTARAYGGEDTNMYGLPRWGCTGTAETCGQKEQYWSQSLQQKLDPNTQNVLQQ